MATGSVPPKVVATRRRQHGPTYRAPLVPATGAYLGAYVQPKVNQGGISALQSFEHELGGSFEVVHVYHPWGAVFPTSEDRYFVDRGKILLLTWGGEPNTLAIIAGKDDAMIRARAEAVKALDHPILIEFRHEMDRPNLQGTIHGPADYVAAWDHIAQSSPLWALLMWVGSGARPGTDSRSEGLRPFTRGTRRWTGCVPTCTPLRPPSRSVTRRALF